jgi:hypothetical protein
MSDTRLVPCRACARHVRLRDAACPFCGASNADAATRASSMRVLSKRLPRVALFAVGAGTIALASCGDSSSGSGTEATDAAVDAPTATPLYGGPPTHPADASPAADAEPDTSFVGAYGGPPFDSGLGDHDADTD